MVHGAHVNDQSRAGRGGSDAGDFGRDVRQFALDAREVLSRPDSSPDELIGLDARVFYLLDEVPGTRASGLRRWLLAVRQRIGVKLQSWSAEDLESLLASG